MNYERFTKLRQTIYLGYDQNAESQKQIFYDALKHFGTVIDLSKNSSTLLDYISITAAVCKEVVSSNCYGVLACGTGMGVSIIANKHKRIIAARCVSSEDAVDSRLINGSNVLCLSAKTDKQINAEIIRAFFNTDFTLSQKRQFRLNQLITLEGANFI